MRLAEEAVALVPPMIYTLAEFLVAKAEVSQQAGDLGEAEESLRRALQFYQRRRALPLADRTMPCSPASACNAPPGPEQGTGRPSRALIPRRQQHAQR